MKPLLSTKKITTLEIIIWLLFFTILLATSVFGMNMLENVMLGLGLVIGVIAILKVIMLAKHYQQHQKEIMAWVYRFCVFKVVPMVLPLITRIL